VRGSKGGSVHVTFCAMTAAAWVGGGGCRGLFMMIAKKESLEPRRIEFEKFVGVKGVKVWSNRRGAAVFRSVLAGRGREPFADKSKLRLAGAAGTEPVSRVRSIY